MFFHPFIFVFQEMFQGLETMEDEDFEVEQMMKRHKKAGGVLLGNGTNVLLHDLTIMPASYPSL
jgi:hypothetical protein